MFIGGSVLLLIGIFVLRVSTRAKRMTNAPSYSKSVNAAALSSDIYTEHGMVTSADGISVRPQMKKSGSYYDALL